MRFLFNLLCTVLVILGLGAVGAWVRSYYAADHVTFRRPFGPGGQRVAAQARSELGLVTFTLGIERVRPTDLPKLQWDGWTKPGLTHVGKPLATLPASAQPVAAMASAQARRAQSQPVASQPAQAQPVAAAAAPTAPASADAIERLGTFSHAPDPRTGTVRVGKHQVTVATERSVTVFPHWALALGLFLLPLLNYAYGSSTRGGSDDGSGPGRRRRIDRLHGAENSYDAWASRTPPQRRRQLPLTRIG